MLGGVDPQSHIGGKDEGSDIKRGAVGMGHPVPVHPHQGLHGLNKVLRRHRGDTHPVAGVDAALGVAVGAEELDVPGGGAVGLQALEQLLGVVEHHGGRVQGEGLIGDNPGIVPAFALGVVHQEHVVGENLAEAQLTLICGLCFWGLGAFNPNIKHGKDASSR